jgi:hypothetical protein
MAPVPPLSSTGNPTFDAGLHDDASPGATSIQDAPAHVEDPASRVEAEGQTLSEMGQQAWQTVINLGRDVSQGLFEGAAAAAADPLAFAKGAALAAAQPALEIVDMVSLSAWGAATVADTLVRCGVAAVNSASDESFLDLELQHSIPRPTMHSDLGQQTERLVTEAVRD